MYITAVTNSTAAGWQTSTATAAIPKATAVIVNPTHCAAAIRYETDSMGAPKVLAKDKNYLAMRIRQTALEHQVPIVEDHPLDDALYKPE